MFSVKVVKLVSKKSFQYSLTCVSLIYSLTIPLANVLKSFKDARCNHCTVLKSVLQRTMLPIKPRLIYSEARRSEQISGKSYQVQQKKYQL